jgi:hypothetical protein
MYHGSEINHRTKIAPSILRPKRKWSKILHNLHINPHPEKSTTSCNRLSITSDIPHPTLHTFQPKPTKIAKPNLRHITSHTTTLQPITLNLRQFHRYIPSPSATNHISYTTQHQPSSQNQSQSTSTSASTSATSSRTSATT